MPRHTRKPENKPIDQYHYKETSRTNSPQVGLATLETGRATDTARLIIPDVTDALLSEMVSKIVKHFHPEKIILFGSRAWGEPTRESDLDLLVVMDVDGSPIHKAAEISRIARPRFLPIDIIVRTPNEIEHRIEIGDPFIKRIMNKGKVLYE